MEFWHEVMMQIMQENKFEQNQAILKYISVSLKKTRL